MGIRRSGRPLMKESGSVQIGRGSSDTSTSMNLNTGSWAPLLKIQILSTGPRYLKFIQKKIYARTSGKMNSKDRFKINILGGSEGYYEYFTW